MEDSLHPADRMPELWAHYTTCGPTARKVLLLIAKRLAQGAKIGDFAQAKDWAAEAAEEGADAAIYLTVAALQAQEAQTAAIKAVVDAAEAHAAAREAKAAKDKTEPLWVPKPGEACRVTHRRFQNYAPFVGDVIVWPAYCKPYAGYLSIEHFDEAGNSSWRMLRVEPL